MNRVHLTALLCAGIVLCGCPKKEDDGGGAPAVNRCEVDMAALGITHGDGTGSFAAVIDDDAQLIGGQWAQGEQGDTLLSNDRVRVVIQKPSRHIGPNPYGGNIIDADIVRPDGEKGSDQFGKMAVLYSFGRTTVARNVEVLRDGSEGGSAVVAVTGDDTVNDFINVQNMIAQLIGEGTRFVISPETQVPARITTYYVLNPGETRVRMLTAFCNDTDTRIIAPVGDLVDRGGTVEFFNPGSCENSMGSASSCFVETSPWFGWQGEGAAYAIRNHRFDDLSMADTASAVLTVAGISVSLVQGEGMQGLSAWLDAAATRRPGNFIIPAKAQKSFLRDFYIGRELGEVAAAIAGEGTAITVRVNDAAGQPKAGVRVAFISDAGPLLTVATTNSAGVASTKLASLSGVTVQAAFPGHLPSEVTAASADMTVALGGTQRLTVNVRDPFNAASPAKVTVLCPGGACVPTTKTLKRFYDHEVLPDNVAAIAFVPPQGSLELQLPPAQYQVIITRGPEYNAWPSSWPVSGEPVDLTAAQQTVDAVLARVIDTAGWMSADLHVHSVNSPDSALRNELRVVNFAAEGVDVLCSTDHDFITDFAPFIRSTGAESVLASMIGLEVTPFDWGHYNSFPLTTNATVNGGAFDWAGGEGPTLRQGQMIDGVKEIWPSAVVQLNHPRGALGSLTLMKVDTPTLATHALPEGFRQDPAPDATADDTKLFTDKWDALEIMNDSSITGAQTVMNDWFTFLSRGTLKTGTATSDTHYALAHQGGYPRTFVDMGGNDNVSSFDPGAFAEALKRHHALGTNGPFMKVSARKLSGGVPVGSAVGMGDTLAISAGEEVELTVDVQAPEWMSFDTIEIFTHAPGREAFNGSENNSWPSDRVHQSRSVSLATGALEPVVLNGQTFRRHHITETFTLSPTSDSWYVVTVRSNAAGRTLFPLHFMGVTCTGGQCSQNEATPFAFSNPIFVDTDGGGYNRFPLSPLPPPPLQPQSPPLRDEALVDALRRLSQLH